MNHHPHLLSYLMGESQGKYPYEKSFQSSFWLQTYKLGQLCSQEASLVWTFSQPSLLGIDPTRVGAWKEGFRAGPDLGWQISSL
jgi:hypothetical protein